MPKLYFPILISPHVRLEPEMSFSENDTKHGDNIGSASQFTIGVGVFPILNLRESSLFYYGFRFGSQQIHVFPDDHRSESKARGLYLSLCIGAEYFLDPHVSLGSELQTRYSSLRITHTDWADPFEKRQETSTIALIFVRFYP